MLAFLDDDSMSNYIKICLKHFYFEWNSPWERLCFEISRPKQNDGRFFFYFFYDEPMSIFFLKIEWLLFLLK